MKPVYVVKSCPYQNFKTTFTFPTRKVYEVKFLPFNFLSNFYYIKLNQVLAVFSDFHYIQRKVPARQVLEASYKKFFLTKVGRRDPRNKFMGRSVGVKNLMPPIAQVSTILLRNS